MATTLIVRHHRKLAVLHGDVHLLSDGIIPMGQAQYLTLHQHCHKAIAATEKIGSAWR